VRSSFLSLLPTTLGLDSFGKINRLTVINATVASHSVISVQNCTFDQAQVIDIICNKTTGNLRPPPSPSSSSSFSGSTNSSSLSSTSGLGTGAMVAIAIGCVAAVLIVCITLATYLFWRFKRSNAHADYLELPSDLPQSSFIVTTLQDSSTSSSSSRSGPRDSTALGDVLRSWEIDLKEVIIYHPPLSQGGYGVVSKGQYHGTTVAVKTFLSYMGAVPVEEYGREIALLCQLHHPNIVLFMGACSDGNAPSIVTEFAERGSLFDVIHQHGDELTLKRTHKILSGAAKGMLYLHSLVPPILHRDLKSGNVLVTRNWQAKICDFGLSRSASLAATMTKRIGTTRWTPPEILSSQPYGKAADSYSFGIVIWECFGRALPFAEENWDAAVEELILSGVRPVIPASMPSTLAELVRECWTPKPEDRPHFEAILSRLEGWIV